MTMSWCRFYDTDLHDPRIQSMPEAMQRRFFMLRLLHIDNKIDLYNDDDIAFALHITPQEAAITKALFLEKKFITPTWRLIEWDKEQCPSDSSKERMRKLREKRKSDGTVRHMCANSAKSVTDRSDQIRSDQNRSEKIRSTTVAESETRLKNITNVASNARENPPSLFKNNFMIVLAELFGDGAIAHPHTAHKIATMCSVWESGGVTDEHIRGGYAKALEQKGRGSFGALYLQNIVLEIANPVQPKKSTGGGWRGPTDAEKAENLAWMHEEFARMKERGEVS
jgi:hypothetical protein